MIPLICLKNLRKEILYCLKSEASKAIDSCNFELAHDLTYCLKKLEETVIILQNRIDKDAQAEQAELLKLAADIAAIDNKNFGEKS
jgi:hypothetical protein